MNRRRGQAGGVIASLMFVLAILAGMAVIAIAIGVWSFSEVRVDSRETSRGTQVKVETPLGAIRVEQQSQVNPRSFGVPVYPGAKLTRGDSKAASIEIDLGGDRSQMTVVAAQYSTPDSVDSVREWYRRQLPHWILSRHGMEYSEGGFKRIIVLKRKWNETRIVLASVGEPAAN
ncbi:MAG: hypothetical protein ACRD88_04815 [Terriglobia bacterium]